METKDRAKLGQTTYQASVYKFDEDDAYPDAIWSGEFPSLESAVLDIKIEIKAREPQFLHGIIYEGTWMENDFHDDEYGMIHDAVWEQNDHVTWDLSGKGDDVQVEKSEW